MDLLFLFFEQKDDFNEDENEDEDEDKDEDEDEDEEEDSLLTSCKPFMMIPKLILAEFTVLKKWLRMDGRMDLWMDKPSYRDAWTHLKSDAAINGN